MWKCFISEYNIDSDNYAADTLPSLEIKQDPRVFLNFQKVNENELPITLNNQIKTMRMLIIIGKNRENKDFFLIFAPQTNAFYTCTCTWRRTPHLFNIVNSQLITYRCFCRVHKYPTKVWKTKKTKVSLFQLSVMHQRKLLHPLDQKTLPWKIELLLIKIKLFLSKVCSSAMNNLILQLLFLFVNFVFDVLRPAVKFHFLHSPDNTCKGCPLISHIRNIIVKELYAENLFSWIVWRIYQQRV